MHTAVVRQADFRIRTLYYWANLGLLPYPQSGGGRGRQSDWPSDTLEKAAILRASFQQRFDSREAALELYLQGHQPADLELLRHALIRQYERQLHALAPYQDPRYQRRKLKQQLPAADRQTRYFVADAQKAALGSNACVPDDSLPANLDIASKIAWLQDLSAEQLADAIQAGERLRAQRRTEMVVFQAALIEASKHVGVTLMPEDIGAQFLVGHRCLRGHSLLEAWRVETLVQSYVSPLSPAHQHALERYLLRIVPAVSSL